MACKLQSQHQPPRTQLSPNTSIPYTTHQLPEVVKDAGHSGVGVIILLWWLHLPASLADEPRRQGSEQVELLPWIGGHGKVMSANKRCCMKIVKY